MLILHTCVVPLHAWLKFPFGSLGSKIRRFSNNAEAAPEVSVTSYLDSRQGQTRLEQWRTCMIDVLAYEVSSSGGTLFNPGGSTYAAPAANISTVLALVRPDNVATKRIVAIVMTVIRAVVLARALQMTTGTSKKVRMRDAINVRAAFLINESENMYTFGSLEIPRQRFCLLGKPAPGGCSRDSKS